MSSWRHDLISEANKSFLDERCLERKCGVDRRDMGGYFSNKIPCLCIMYFFDVTFLNNLLCLYCLYIIIYILWKPFFILLYKFKNKIPSRFPSRFKRCFHFLSRDCILIWKVFYFQFFGFLSCWSKRCVEWHLIGCSLDNICPKGHFIISSCWMFMAKDKDL